MVRPLHKVIFVLALGAIVSVFAFIEPHTALSRWEQWVAGWVGLWIAPFLGALSHGVAFASLTLALLWLWAGEVIRCAAIMAAVAVALELGQAPIAHRTASVADAGWSLAGVASAIALYALVSFGTRKARHSWAREAAGRRWISDRSRLSSRANGAEKGEPTSGGGWWR